MQTHAHAHTWMQAHTFTDEEKEESNINWPSSINQAYLRKTVCDLPSCTKLQSYKWQHLDPNEH